MTTPIDIAEEQRRLWNGPSGHAWIDSQEMLDRLFQPFEEMLVAAATALHPGGVLDVGCGTGATTLAIARSLGAQADCVGVDISEPMLDLARARAKQYGTPARFICADAQSYAFPSARFDLLVSRFGVMFFDRPVEAFANLRRAMTEQGQMHCIVWRSVRDNPFMTTAERAAAPLLPNLPPRRPDVPGQFAFADPQYVQQILEQSGWQAIDIQAIDVACTLRESELVSYVSRLGPVGLALQDADATTRKRVIAAVRAAFEPFVVGGEVRFDAACWRVTARA